MVTPWPYTGCFSSSLLRPLGAAFLFALGISMSLIIAPASAVNLVNDTWIDGTDTDPAPPTYAENNGTTGTDADGDGNLESVWIQSGAGTLNPAAANGPLRFDLTGTAASSSTMTTYFTPEGNEVNLASAGDKIKVTWAFSLTNVNAAGNTSQNFRFALADASDGSRATANGSLPSTAWRGYALFANMSPTLGNSNPFQLRRRTLGNAGNLLNTSGDFQDPLGNGATSGAHGYDAATPYTMTWEITRNASNGLDMDVKITGGTLDNDGTAQVTVTDATPVGVDSATAPFGSYKFDTFSLRPSGESTTASVFDTSLFKVEFFSSATPPGVPGDYNGNGKVDGADYVVWRKGGPLQNEVDAPGTVNAVDYTEWRARFGNTSGAGAGVSAAGVPEPGTIGLLLAGVLGMSLGRRRA